MLARLETAFEHERRFIAEASHELRTPLALLRTELELALRKPRSREELEDALRSAAEETDRLTALAADLLLIARSDEQRRCRSTPKRSRRADLLATVAERFARARRRSSDERGASRSRPDVVFEADPKRVEQALGNLVDNALLHGAGTVHARRSARAGDRVELHVTDEGAGFPAGFADARLRPLQPRRRGAPPQRQRARARDRAARSRSPTAAASGVGRARTAAPTSGSRCRSVRRGRASGRAAGCRRPGLSARGAAGARASGGAVSRALL